MKKVSLIVWLLSLFCISSFGQFEQKFTINAAGGVSFPQGANEYPVLHQDQQSEYILLFPHIFGNLKPGFSPYAGLQYNHNQHFSIEARIASQIFMTWEWEDPVTHDVESSGDAFFIEYFNIGIGLCPKYYLTPGQRTNPYIFAVVSANYGDVSFSDPDNVPVIVNGSFDPGITFGVFPGIGTDLMLNEQFGFFLQAGYSFCYMKPLMEDVVDEPTNFKSIRAELGIKLNLLKSKQL